jgi:hypothetical protein
MVIRQKKPWISNENKRETRQRWKEKGDKNKME